MLAQMNKKQTSLVHLFEKREDLPTNQKLPPVNGKIVFHKIGLFAPKNWGQLK